MNFSSQRVFDVSALTALALLVVGCASPGTPRPPSLHLPQRLTQVHADRRGGVVVIGFTTPVRSSDSVLLTSPVLATLCRAVGDGPCKPTASFPDKLQIAGPVEWKDVLPAELASGPDRLLTYRVELFTQKGRSAGPSDPAYAAAGQSPEQVQGLKAEGSRKGVLLRWAAVNPAGSEILLERDDLGAPPVKPKTPVAAKKPVGRKGHTVTTPKPLTPGKATAEAAVVWLHSERTGSGEAGGMFDSGAHAGEPYRYTAVRSRKANVVGKSLELRSEVSAATEITLSDVYPPAVPKDLQAASFAADGNAFAADLVWAPDTETDLAGYNVYRETANASGGYGARTKLNEKPVALPGFHDATLARGVGYRYTVTAVDRKGNESAASAAAELEPTP